MKQNARNINGSTKFVFPVSNYDLPSPMSEILHSLDSAECLITNHILDKYGYDGVSIHEKIFLKVIFKSFFPSTPTQMLYGIMRQGVEKLKKC